MISIGDGQYWPYYIPKCYSERPGGKYRDFSKKMFFHITRTIWFRIVENLMLIISR